MTAHDLKALGSNSRHQQDEEGLKMLTKRKKRQCKLRNGKWRLEIRDSNF